MKRLVLVSQYLVDHLITDSICDKAYDDLLDTKNEDEFDYVMSHDLYDLLEHTSYELVLDLDEEEDKWYSEKYLPYVRDLNPSIYGYYLEAVQDFEDKKVQDKIFLTLGLTNDQLNEVFDVIGAMEYRMDKEYEKRHLTKYKDVKKHLEYLAKQITHDISEYDLRKLIKYVGLFLDELGSKSKEINATETAWNKELFDSQLRIFSDVKIILNDKLICPEDSYQAD